MKKKFLLISDNKILGVGGGSLEEHKYYDGLKNYCQEHNCELKVLSIDEELAEALVKDIRKTRILDVASRVFGHSTYMYFIWKKYKKTITGCEPNVIILGRSRFGFIAKDIKRILPKCKVVCNMENIEFDYVDGYFANTTNKIKKIYIAIEKWCVKRDEREAIIYSDALDYLTKRDFRRAHELYKVKNKREMILPICIETETNLTLNSDKKTVVFIGSLNYGSNVDALINFINKVWIPHFLKTKELQLVIGGSNPNEKIRELTKKISNCTLYDNFASLEDIVPINSMVIAPIQKGAGMKVKVAETLSMGLMIAASDEALVGYEKILECDKMGSIIRANSSDEYKKAIISYLEKTDDDMLQISNQNKNIYRKQYSYNISRQRIAELCKDML